jgi:short-subunit dehydrogenase
MATKARPLAVVTGASSGIGLELARLCARNGFDLVIAADEPQIHTPVGELRQLGASVDALQVDLATEDGVAELCDVIGGRAVEALIANAGRGLGHAFLEQEWTAVRRVIDTNVTGTLCLLHKIGRDMQARSRGRILIVGSIAGFMPGTYQAVYNGTKALIDSFAVALRHELKDSGVTVSCLMPGPTETKFFERAGLMDTKVGTDKKQPADEVARAGFEAMMRGEDVVSGFKNKVQAAISHVLPADTVAEMHTRLTKPGTAAPRKS